MKRIVIAIVILLSSAGYAAADPISITASAAYFLTTIGVQLQVAYTIAQVVVTAAFVVGPTAASLLLNRRGGSGGVDPEATKHQQNVPESPEINAEGLVRISGIVGLANTPDGYERDRLLFHCSGITDGVEQHFLGDREVIVDPNGDVSSPPYARPGSSWVNIQSKIGDGTETAWPILKTNFPDFWDDDNRARGVAQTLLRFFSPGYTDEKYLKIYHNGVPEYERVSREGLIYDPRDGSTAYSTNGILRCLHIARRALRLQLSDFDLDFIADEADKADVLVNTLTGTEPRSRISGIWSSEDNRVEIMQSALASAGADFWIGPDGTYRIGLVDDQPTSTFSIPARHIPSYTLLTGPERPQRPNLIRLWYYSSERGYAIEELTIHTFDDHGEYDGPAWARYQDEIDRYGEQPFDLKLSFCPSASQAQRIGRRMFAEARAETGTVETNFYGVAVWGHRRIDIEFIDLDDMPVCKVTQPNIDDENRKTVIPFLICPTLPAWNPATDEVAAPDPLPDLSYTGDIDPPSIATESTVVTYPVIYGDSRSGLTETRFSGFSTPSGTDTFEGAYRYYTGGTPSAYASTVDSILGSPVHYAVAETDLTGVLTDFKNRVFNSDEDGSNWSEVFQSTPAEDNTVTSAPFVAAVPNGGLTQAQVSVTAPMELNVSWVSLTGTDGTDEEYAVRPGEVNTINVSLPAPEVGDQTITWTVQAFTSNDTASATAEDFITIPGTG